MLADTILAFPQTPFARLVLPDVHHRLAWKTFTSRLETAHRFSLQRDAAQMILGISQSSPKRFQQALGVCRLPFRRMWIEFAFKDRMAWLEQDSQHNMHVVKHEDAPPPQRLGFYLEQLDDNGRKFFFQPAWVHPDGATSICQLGIVINTDPNLVIDIGEHDDAWRKKAERGWSDAWIDNPDEVRALLEMEKRIEIVIPKWNKPIWDHLAEKCSKNTLERMFDLAIYDLRSEWRFVLGLLTTLNSRNVVQISDTVDNRKINKARARTGKAPLLDHSEIRLALSHAQRMRIAVGGNRGPVSASHVRGHFKLRKSGLWWWSDHLRGGNVVFPKVYDVRA